MSKLHNNFILACTKLNGQAIWIEGTKLPRCILESEIDESNGKRKQVYIDFKKENQIEFSYDYHGRVTINNVIRINAANLSPKSENKKELQKEVPIMFIASKNSDVYIDTYGNYHVKIK